MEFIFGAVSIRGLDSFLVPPNAWLLMAGFPDVRQAARAATNFIVNVRRIQNGSHVAVTGIKKTVGQQPAFEMTDINLAGTLALHFIASEDFQADLATAEPEIKLLFSKRKDRKRLAKPAARKGGAKRARRRTSKGQP